MQLVSLLTLEKSTQYGQGYSVDSFYLFPILGQINHKFLDTLTQRIRKKVELG